MIGLSRTDAVLFDLDGTLVHSPIDFAAMKAAVRAIAARHGVADLTATDVLGLLTQASGRIAQADRVRFRDEAEAAILSEELRAAREVVAAPGAPEVLGRLRDAGKKIAVVTRNSRQIARTVLADLALVHDVLVAREDTPRPKPAPIHLRLALVRLRVSPRNAVFVGDHAMDALGGRRAGMRTFGVPTPGDTTHAAFAAQRPDVMLEDLHALLAHLSI